MRIIRSSLFSLVLAASLGVPTQAQVGPNLGLLNPNLASAEELAGVAGLPAAAVDEIVGRRPFLRMGELHAVVSAHVAAEALEGVYRAMWVPIDVNDVSDEEIFLIPGVGERMLHEFEEYRPYQSIAQFRREIGKYVDDDEVARLERYVEIR